MQHSGNENSEARHVSEILRHTIGDLFQLTAPEKEVLSIEARNREWPKICELLGIEEQEL